jgi:RHH-type proline utilization regulon transcriptional repressor/proline dehydrogenase/delta 1-pyrroline-5-carboxylate dehydrogenase
MAHVPGELNHLFYQPRGVGVVIAPWNFPLAIPTGMVSAALVAGNAVLFKPAMPASVIGLRLVEILREAGVPPEVIAYLPCKGSTVGAYLVEHEKVDFLAFTGSKEVGLNMVEKAAFTKPGQKSVKKVIAEMGGKNAIIVDSDADLDEAVRGVIYSAFGFAGQKCSACSRVIVLPENYDRFVKRLIEAAGSIVVGDPTDPRSFLGPVIDEAAQKSILEYVAIGEREGETLLKQDVPAEGYFVGPTIIEIKNPKARIAQEEIFGPILAVLKARDFDQALEIANDTAFALTGGLFSRSPENIARARQEYRVGNLYINRGCTGALVARHPFGGFKMSGVGSKAGGPDYLLQFMEPRSVSENTLRRGFAPEE